MAGLSFLFLLVFLLSTGGLLVGMISPKSVLKVSFMKWKVEIAPLRKNVFKIYGFFVLASLILMVLVSPARNISQSNNTAETKKALELSVPVSTTPTTSIAITSSTTIIAKTKTTPKPVENIQATTTQINTQTKNENGYFTVTRIVDGDTIQIDTGEKVRYIGIDTPETKDPRKPVQCFGKEAVVKNTALVLNKKVRLEKDITDKDRYGRLLRYVYIGDTFINLELVKTGYAKAYTYPPDVKYSKLFVEAQTIARETNVGLWVACAAQNNAAVTNTTTQPANTPTTSQTNAQTQTSNTSQCAIKGNISSTGEKIYHLPGCGSYAKTVIDESTGERLFCSEQEATQAGWRKASNC